ncbi:uncharacterized protein TRAVEDRAFT_74379 [Trametes versicolor FP-101664 SS1]|uniref:uncharacterized protein n=1 Tax=Trametes versicolor (strain FP-101664) TaxID=717944 RepID=UPI0004622C62|nr:uncharacterized protein TRAVEDRAFT_74379 [Trametes versicolor FP-101664 SS1]EIW54117.1 hypothetical protein TRAVEDRAFT_74379 [Trametes versicolor FP-101664 SS1]
MSQRGVDIWGVITGVFGALAIISPILWGLIYTQLPSVKLRTLDALLFETDQLLRKSVDEGLISEDQFRLLMWATLRRIDRVRIQVYPSGPWSHEYTNWKKGISRDITVLIAEVNEIRAKIARSSSKERQKLDASGKAADLILSARKLETTLSAMPSDSGSMRPSASSLLLAHLDPPLADSGRCPHTVPLPAVTIAPPATDATLYPSPFGDIYATSDNKQNLTPASDEGSTHEHSLPSSGAPPLVSGDSRTRRAMRRALLARFGKELLASHPHTLPCTPVGETPSHRSMSLESDSALSAR